MCPQKWGFSCEVPSHGPWNHNKEDPLTPHGEGGIPPGQLCRKGWGPRQLCPLLQLFQCHGPVETTVKFILRIFQSWARWRLAGVADPTRREALRPKEIYPPTSTQHRAPPNPMLLGHQVLFVPNQFMPSHGKTLLRKHPALAFLQVHSGLHGSGNRLWLDSTSTRGHLRPGTELAALGKCKESCTFPSSLRMAAGGSFPCSRELSLFISCTEVQKQGFG